MESMKRRKLVKIKKNEGNQIMDEKALIKQKINNSDCNVTTKKSLFLSRKKFII
jgi:hypothetical protein